MAGWKKVCCAIDLSEASRVALREATELVRRFDAELALVHVHPPQPAPGPGPFEPAPEFVDVASAELSGEVGTWQEEAEHAVGRGVQATVLNGATTNEILDELLRFVREHGQDLLVVGSHGRRGVQRLLLGSVAERVAREAPCSVLVVRAPGRSSE
jgi:nucleotide-binding universal stress UspA family protein